MLSLQRAHVRTPPRRGSTFFLDLKISLGVVMVEFRRGAVSLLSVAVLIFRSDLTALFVVVAVVDIGLVLVGVQ